MEAAYPSPIRRPFISAMVLVERAAQEVTAELACHLTALALVVHHHQDRTLAHHPPVQVPEVHHPRLPAPPMFHCHQTLLVTITNNVANADARIPKRRLAKVEEVLLKEVAILHHSLHTPLIRHALNLPSRTMKNASSFLRMRITIRIAL